MSDEIFEWNGLHVARFCGPEREGGKDRRCYQFTVDSAKGVVFTTLSHEGMAELRKVLRLEK